jgi:hypothetical protein
MGNAPEWKYLAHNGHQQDGRLHLLRDGYPACGVAVKAGKGFTGTWGDRPSNAKTCRHCRRLA